MSIKQNTMTPNKLDKSAVDLILPRLQDEYNAFYFYRSASNFLQNMGYVFAAEYFAGESTDELSHAKGLEDYLLSWNVTPNLPDIDKPVLKFDGLVDVINQSYEIEYALYEAYEKTAREMFTTDLCSFAVMQKYLAIQLASIAEYSDFLNQVALIDEKDKLSVLILEKRLFEKG
jgi:ferritin